ncbi:MAG: molybdenum cofactor biosynthesis protein MoaE [Dermatophilaceae bacterium]
MTEGDPAAGGGSGCAVVAEIRDSELSVDEVLRAVRTEHIGAVVLFVGQVRSVDAGRTVEVLEYSCHPSARQVATDLVAGLAVAGHVVRIAVTHRVGRLPVGEIAVVAAVGASHRAEAFEVCRTLVDRFKAEVPIWKHQVFTDGSQEWVGMP